MHKHNTITTDITPAYHHKNLPNLPPPIPSAVGLNKPFKVISVVRIIELIMLPR